MLEIEDLAVKLPRRSANAILSIIGCQSRTFRRAVADHLGAAAGSPGSIVAEPVLEGAHPYELHSGGWDALPSGLHPKTKEALQARMPYLPYAHQARAWELASASDACSIIISSGTGSGKTECFLGALLDRLLVEFDGGAKRLTGVRGLMLYPLNALINSQQERLSTWLSPFGDKLRYCLYNGLTPEGPSPDSERRKFPEQVLDRKALRESPPPLLVTNLTMLEYMLVRRQDAPILQQSRGKLEYIVLDEVHTYVGAQATELALLLRRVAHAFGRDPRTIRVIATSATLGTGDRREQEFSTPAVSQGPDGRRLGTVHAIIGKRAPLDLPPQAVNPLHTLTLETLSEEAAWRTLSSHPRLQDISRRLHGEERIPWSEWRKVSQAILPAGDDVEVRARALLTACARAKRPEDKQGFLPVRLHFFQRTLSGLWACSDHACVGRPGVEAGDWRFGKLFFDRNEICDVCKAPVLEVRICEACGTETLAAEEVDTSDGAGRRLRAPTPESRR